MLILGVERHGGVAYEKSAFSGRPFQSVQFDIAGRVAALLLLTDKSFMDNVCSV
jgi:hypothetical protein